MERKKRKKKWSRRRKDQFRDLKIRLFTGTDALALALSAQLQPKEKVRSINQGSSARTKSVESLCIPTDRRSRQRYSHIIYMAVR